MSRAPDRRILDVCAALEKKQGTQFYLEEVMEYVNAHYDEFFVVAGGREWWRESFRVHRSRIREGGLMNRAYEAWRQAYFGDARPLDLLLKDLFQLWSSFGEERRAALREALFRELEEWLQRPYTDPPPWRDPNSENPKAYLATTVFHRSTDILKERNQRDKFTDRVNEKPLTPRQVGMLKGTKDHFDESSADPSEIITERYDERDQAIKGILTQGRGISRKRVQTIQRARGEQWEPGETKEALGGDNAWRATKTTLREELKKIRKIS